MQKYTFQRQLQRFFLDSPLLTEPIVSLENCALLGSVTGEMLSLHEQVERDR